MADKSEWKIPSMESEGKGDGHQYGRKPRTPEPIPIAGKLTYSEEEMGHWTPTGIEPTDYYDDDVPPHFLASAQPIYALRNKLTTCY